ncbi:catalase [Epithele typhae]|uniref:catalase n=1 Tax=Epithele typhae TaxID=378194 RepID=UPI0020089A0A|nr:catalase [Epithele typhae]KAH9911438.1 catalase [Epithele typhae]
MSAAIGAVKEAFSSVTGYNAKSADLAKATVDVSTAPTKGITTDTGVFVPDTDNWLRATDGARPGASLLEDQVGREKIMRFDHERIPERVVHARGAGAHGYFKVFDDRAAKYTHAPVLTDPSRVTPTFVRFSTVQGSRGSADTVRDGRGFAVEFYTEEGNWDVVGNDIPVFFIQEAIKFPDIIHAVKPEPHKEVPTGHWSAHNTFWDFVGLQPESAHIVMWSYRMMQGFGVNTYTLLNANKERFFVKFHFIPELGVHSLMWDEALKIAGQDPGARTFHTALADLEEAITSGAYAKWQFGIQVIPEAKENDFDFDILDATKPIGELVLNRTVDEYFAETEQVAFCTSHVVPGIGFSDDPLLQGRNFSYFDTQLSRLGINWQELPINRPVCPVMNHHRDGQHQQKITKGPNYWPNSKAAAPPVPVKDGGYAEFPQKYQGIKQRVRSAKFQEHYNQAQLFHNSLSPPEKAHLVAAFSFELSHCDDPQVYDTCSRLLTTVDFELATQVAQAVGAPSRRVAILVADGFDRAHVDGVRAALTAGWRPRGSSGRAAGEDGSGEGYPADHHYEGQRSTRRTAAFGHCKPIGALGEGVGFLRDAVQLPGVNFAPDLQSEAVTNSYGVVTAGKYGLGSVAADLLSIKRGEQGFLLNFAYEVSQHRCFARETDGLTAKVAY